MLLQFFPDRSLDVFLLLLKGLLHELSHSFRIAKLLAQIFHGGDKSRTIGLPCRLRSDTLEVDKFDESILIGRSDFLVFSYSIYSYGILITLFICDTCIERL